MTREWTTTRYGKVVGFFSNITVIVRDLNRSKMDTLFTLRLCLSSNGFQCVQHESFQSETSTETFKFSTMRSGNVI